MIKLATWILYQYSKKTNLALNSFFPFSPFYSTLLLLFARISCSGLMSASRIFSRAVRPVLSRISSSAPAPISSLIIIFIWRKSRIFYRMKAWWNRYATNQRSISVSSSPGVLTPCKKICLAWLYYCVDICNLHVRQTTSEHFFGSY